MERRLLKAIINPSMVVVFVTGPLLAYLGDSGRTPGCRSNSSSSSVSGGAWISRALRQTVRRDANTRPAVFFRILNEVPTVLMILIVVLVVLKPF